MTSSTQQEIGFEQASNEYTNVLRDRKDSLKTLAQIAIRQGEIGYKEFCLVMEDTELNPDSGLFEDTSSRGSTGFRGLQDNYDSLSSEDDKKQPILLRTAEGVHIGTSVKIPSKNLSPIHRNALSFGINYGVGCKFIVSGKEVDSAEGGGVESISVDAVMPFRVLSQDKNTGQDRLKRTEVVLSRVVRRFDYFGYFERYRSKYNNAEIIVGREQIHKAIQTDEELELYDRLIIAKSLFTRT